MSTNWVQDRCNVFCVTLDFTKPRGREILFKLIERADVWMENSKGGSCARLGITDEKLLEINPRRASRASNSTRSCADGSASEQSPMW